VFELRTGTGSEQVLQLTGNFDAASAREIGSFVRALSAPDRAILDFSRSRDVDYYALAVLATDLERASARVALRGLRRREIRLLRYFGIHPADYGVAEDDV
jgi:anti-anti-sigma regulatory factor